ncbi:nuclear receptor [Schistosoma japonicum]|nr:nuclear receptor [Schistosoma japonicum]
MGDRSYSKDLVDLHSLPVKNAKLLLITDIPKHFHASNLRNFFSQFVESSKFLCFHYRHRPDVSFVGTSEVDGVQLLSYIKQFTKSKSTCCAVLSVYDEYVSEFFRLYSGLNWPNENDVVPLELKCTPHLIKHATQEEFDFLPEFKPLSWMPRGNVGTPTQHFFNLIKECKLESSIISRLNLNFLKQPKSRKYGAVPFIYANDEKLHTLESNDVDLDYTVVSNSCIPAKHRIPSNDVSELFSDPVVFEDDDDIPEEWDRFEALHDDPYDLNRGNKAQLKYEGKIELVWEKGGSGLVFHTDQRTWEKLDPLRKEEIFDEPSSFDWDIDMGPYEMPTGIGTGPCPNGFQGADRDTAELIDINREKESIHFVESSKFLCFHYRHRPDVSFVGTSEVDGVQLLSYIKQFTKSKSTCCAVLSVYDEYVSEFFRLYSGLNWPNENDVVPLELKCTPHLIKHATQEEFDFLPEFKPLSWMPRGNVGTPTQHFFNLIKECKLESSIISRLNLNFLKQPKSRKYGAVPFIYANDEKLHTLESNDVDLDYTVVSNSCIPAKHRIPSNDVSELFSDPVVFEDDDDIPEEWDRFEALHDDPYDLNRGNKAQLKYEGKIELVWEKGGSGLVFHTDQRTWEKLDPLRKEEIFDEPSSFDWDIDMGPYEMPTGIGTGPCPNGFQGADRDTAELIDINREKESIHVEDLTYNPHALFTNEVINKRMGWIPGNGLGAKKGRLKISSGIIDPITCEGSLPPKVRTGLGYYGPRILRNSNKRLLNKELTSNITGQALKSVYIRSVFDSPQTVVHRSGLGLSPSLLRRNDPTMVVKWLRDREESLSQFKSSKPSDERVFN